MTKDQSSGLSARAAQEWCIGDLKDASSLSAISYPGPGGVEKV